MNKKILSISLLLSLVGGNLTFATDELPTDPGATTATVISNETAPATETTPTTTTSAEATTPAFQDFKDVPTNHPNYNAIIVLRYQKVLEGYPDNTFRPEQELNRVEALKLIFEVAKIDLTNGFSPASFNDLEANAWYMGYLSRALFLEIVNGYPDGSFQPAKSVNLVEFLKMLELAQKVDLSNTNLNQLAYTDIMPGQWYTKYINYAKMYNLVDADADGKVYPEKPLTRARAAEIIYRFRNLLNQPKDATEPVVTPAPVATITDFALYVSASYRFAIQYPKVWFYSSIDNTDATAIRTYGFGPKDLADNPPTVTLELLPDNANFQPNLLYKTYNYLKETGDNNTIKLSTKIDGSSRIYRLTGSADQEETMLTMMASLTANIEGLETTPVAADATPTTPATTETTPST